MPRFRRNKLKKLLSGFIALLLLSGCVSVIAHDEKKAAAAAEEFARLAFIEQKYSLAYNLISPDIQKTIPLDKFQELVKQMHPKLYPSNIRATEYEPMHGQKAMGIYLEGENGSESFCYSVTMVGTALSGYKIAGIFRGDGSYPASKFRQKLSK